MYIKSRGSALNITVYNKIMLWLQVNFLTIAHILCRNPLTRLNNINWWFKNILDYRVRHFILFELISVVIFCQNTIKSNIRYVSVCYVLVTFRTFALTKMILNKKTIGWFTQKLQKSLVQKTSLTNPRVRNPENFPWFRAVGLP